jgi:hypothetical protein
MSPTCHDEENLPNCIFVSNSYWYVIVVDGTNVSGERAASITYSLDGSRDWGFDGLMLKSVGILG